MAAVYDGNNIGVLDGGTTFAALDTQALAQQGKLLLAWFVAGTIIATIVMGVLVALVVRHVV